jgi:hypothetical protein
MGYFVFLVVAFIEVEFPEQCAAGLNSC